MSEELKQAWKDVLFWARRLSYHSADKHPEWLSEVLYTDIIPHGDTTIFLIKLKKK